MPIKQYAEEFLKSWLNCKLLLNKERLIGVISEALKQFRSKLTAFEQTEILDYPEIWFLGLEAKKIEGVPGGAQNNGYDDENGSYIKVRIKS